MKERNIKMPKILIIYSSTDGQTKRICERIKMNSIYNSDTKIISINDASSESIIPYDNIVIGASIRYGKHNAKVYEFIKKNKKELQEKNTSFFSVNVVARKTNKNTPETNPYIKNFLKISNWKPNLLAVFAGKIDYQKYRFFDKQIIRFIMYITKGPTDTSKAYEFTDWGKVDLFTKTFDESCI